MTEPAQQLTTAGVIALVPAKDRADRVGATVSALEATAAIDAVLVIDDGSSDATAEQARAAGAYVLRLPVNVGKGGAIAAGIAAAPHASIYLLIDADLGDTAAAAADLLAPVLRGDADMTIGVLPGAGRKGGFGTIKRFAASGIRRAASYETRAPLSGQRAIRGELLRSLSLAGRFGLEVGLTVDAVRAGARVREIDVGMDHRHTGRSVAGFRHRGRQGIDIARALWPRLTSPRTRVALTVAAALVALIAMVMSAGRSQSAATGGLGGAEKVVIIGVPHLGIGDLDPSTAPTMYDIATSTGAVAAMSVRTISGRPRVAEAYASLGAGARIPAGGGGANAADASEPFAGTTARAATAWRVGRAITGQVVVPGGPSVVRQAEGDHLSSVAGALGTALRRSHRVTAVIGNADWIDDEGSVMRSRPAAIALMDDRAQVALGHVAAEGIISRDASVAGGRRADPEGILRQLDRVMGSADVILLDPGDTVRAAMAEDLSNERAARASRARALRATDQLLRRVIAAVAPDTLVLVVGMTPPSRTWELTPLLAYGAGVDPGYLHSPSTQRLGLVTLTDVAPTVLSNLDVDEPEGFVGHPLGIVKARADLAMLRNMNDAATYRERIYFPITMTFIVLQALLYLLAAATLRVNQGARNLASWLKVAVLAVAAFPVATFVFRALPGWQHLGGIGPVVLLVTDGLVVAGALRFRRSTLAPLAAICGATVGLLVVDLALGARLQLSSLLGYSPHTAARFTGLGNTAFATLAATAVIGSAIHIFHAPRRREAVVTVACIFAVVLVADGAPMLGSDVGGILTLAPVFGLTLAVLAGRRISTRLVVLAVLVTMLLLGVAAGVDLLRPADERTHLGRLITEVADGGGSVFVDTVARKLTVNLRVLQRSIWTWSVPIATGFMLYVLVWTGGWLRLLPSRSPLRAGVVGTLVAGVLGWAVNDSGIVVTALVYVYLGPFLTLLALGASRGEPVVLSPAKRAEVGAGLTR